MKIKLLSLIITCFFIIASCSSDDDSASGGTTPPPDCEGESCNPPPECEGQECQVIQPPQACANTSKVAVNTSDKAYADTYTFTTHTSDSFIYADVSQTTFDKWNAATANSPAGIALLKDLIPQAFATACDGFDIVYVVLNNRDLPVDMAYGEYHHIKNDVDGIMTSGKFDNSADYGSAGILEGAIIMYTPFSQSTGGGFNLRGLPMLHEFTHRFANFASGLYMSGGGHWPPCSDFSIVSPFQCVADQQSNNRVQGKLSYAWDNFSPIELFFLGFIGTPTEEPAMWDNWSCANCASPATATQSGKALFQQEPLTRSPSYLTAQKSYRALVVVLDGPGGDPIFFDNFVADLNGISSDFNSHSQQRGSLSFKIHQ